MAMMLMLMFESSSEYPPFLIAVTPGEHSPDNHTYKTPGFVSFQTLTITPLFGSLFYVRLLLESLWSLN